MKTGKELRNDRARKEAEALREKRKQEKYNSSGDRLKQAEEAYQRYRQRKQAERQNEAAERVNNWLERSRVISRQYTNRYGSGTEGYRADSDAWLKMLTTRRDSMDTDALDIGKFLKDNRDILGESFYKQVNGMIWDSRNLLSEMVGQAQREHDYYSQWESEDAYNLDRQRWQEQEEMRGFDLEAGEKELEALKQKRAGLASQTGQPASSYLTGGTAQTGMPYAAAHQKPGERDRELAELDRTISQKNQYLTLARRLQEADALSAVTRNPDYWELSRSQEDVQDVEYRYINDEAFRHQYQKMLNGEYDNLHEGGLDILTEDEKKIYNYHYAKGGQEQAREYLNSIRERLNYRRAEQRFEGYDDNTLLEMAFGVEAGIDQFQSGMRSALWNSEGDYVAPSSRQVLSGMVREDLGEKSGFAQGAYDVVTTTANMAPSILTSTVANILAPGSGAYIGAGMMGMSAGGSAYQEMINRGYSKEQSRTYGLLVGASEAVLGEMLGGISKLGGKVSGKLLTGILDKVDNVFLRTIGKIGGNMLSEGSEEMLQEVLTPWFESIITGEEYQVQSEDVWYAGLLGALSAGLLEGPTTVSGEYGTYRQGAQLKDAGIDPERLKAIGQTFSADTVAYKLAGKVDANTDAYTIGRLFNALDAELTQANRDSITESLVSKGMDERSARKLAKGFGDVLSGKPMTEQQVAAIAMNDVLRDTVKDVILNENSTAYQRNLGFNEVLRELGGERKAETRSAEPETAAEENAPQAASDGQARLLGTNEAVEIQGVESIRDGEMTLKLADGRTVRAEDVSFGSEGEAMVYSALAGMNVHPEVANTLMENYRMEDTDGEVYAKGVEEAYRFGQLGYPMAQAAKGPFTSMLTQRQREAAYGLGRAFSEAKVTKQQAAVKTAVAANTGTGRVRFDGDRKLLTQRQQTSLKALDLVANAMGIQIHVFESKVNSKGERGANGWFDPRDNSIHIDLHAGSKAEGTMLFTAAHELTHFVKKWSPEKFKTLSDFLMEEYGKAGHSVEERVQDQIRMAREGAHHRELSYEEAFEEVIADSMETMLSDGDVIAKLEKLKSKDKGLWEKIRDFVTDLAAKIKKAYEGLTADSPEGQYVAEMKDAAERLKDLFTEGLSDAGSNYQAAMERGAAPNASDTSGDSEIRYSLRDVKVPTREELEKKDPLDVVDISKPQTKGTFAERRKRILERAEEVIKKPYLNRDTGVMVFLTPKSYTHIFSNSGEINLNAAEHLPELIENAILTHAEGPEYGSDYTDGVYTFFAAVISETVAPVKIKVKEYSYEGQRLPANIEAYFQGLPQEYASTYDAVVLQVEEIEKSPSGSARGVNQNDPLPGPDGLSRITVAELLDLVKGKAEKYVPKHEVKYSERREESVSDRALLAAAFEELARTDLERQKIREYQQEIQKLDAQEEKLRNLRSQIRELSFAKGPRDKKQIQELRDEAIKTANRINISDSRLLRMEASAPLKAVLEREKKKARQKEQARSEAAMKKYQKEVNEKIQHLRDTRKENVDSRKRTELRKKIRKKIMELRNLLNHGSRERNVKAGMRDFVTEALASAEVLFIDNYTNEDMVWGGVRCDLEDWERRLLGATRALIQKQKELMDEALQTHEVEDVIVGNTAGYYARMKEYDRLSGEIRANMRQLAGVFARERARLNKTQVDEVLDKLANAYRKLGYSDDPYIRNAVDETVYQHLLSTKDKLAGAVVRDMNRKQLQMVYDAYKMILTTVRNANKLFVNGREVDAAVWVTQAQGELKKTRHSTKDLPAAVQKIQKFVQEYSWEMLSPVDAFERLGSKKLMDMFWDMIKGQNEYAASIEEAAAFVEQARKDYGYRKWDLKKARTFELADGKIFKLTLADILSIYAYSKREQAIPHMTEGGFTFDTGHTYKDKRTKKVSRKLEEPYRVNLEEIQMICDTLTEQQRAYADRIQKYLTEFGKRGNKASRTLWGIDLFTEEVYFPLMSERDYRSSVETALNSTQTVVSLKNAGMSKETTPGANNPIVLRAFDDVVLEHLDKMAKYAAYVVPIENIQKVFNSVGRIKDGNNNFVSTKALISSIFGESAERYLLQYITDVNGGTHAGGARSPAADFFSKSKGAAVAANTSVVIQQFFSVIRAMDEINPKHFIPLLNGKASRSDGKVYEEMKKYAKIAVIKEMGGFDIGSNAGLKNYAGLNQAPIDGKVVMSKIQDFQGWGATVMDKFGWVTIWKAVKKEVAETTKLKPGSEEFLKACGERFTEVVVRTQVYDSVNSRSGYMRSDRDEVKYMTSFMGEPTRIAGMAFSSANRTIRAMQNGDKAQIRKALGRNARTALVLTVSTLMNNLAKSLVYAARDDDEDEAYWERWAKHVGSNLASDVNPFGMLPFFRDIVSLIQDYDVERPDLALIADLIKTGKKMIRMLEEGEEMTDEELMETILQLAGDGGNLGGVAIKNITREISSFARLIKDYKDGIEPADMAGAFRRGWEGIEQPKRESIYKAIIAGDTAREAALRATYKDDGSYTTEVRKALREYEPRIQEAAQAFHDEEYQRYETLLKEIRKEGHFEHNDIYAAIQAEVREMEKAEQPEEEAEGVAENKQIYTAKSYFNALLAGKKESAKLAFDVLYEAEIDEGYLPMEAESNVKSSLATQIGNAYKNGEITRKQALDMLEKYADKGETDVKKWDFEMKYGYSWGSRDRAYRKGAISGKTLTEAVMDIEGDTREDAEEYVRFLELEMAHTDLEITTNLASSYFEYAEPAGIELDVYMKFKEQSNDMSSEYDENGKEVTSKKSKVMDLIDSMDLTNEQKDALYYAAGYKESTLNDDAPWRKRRK